MKHLITFILLVSMLTFAGLVSAAPDPKDPCSAPFWEEYSGDELVSELTVQLEANTVVTEKDTYFLRLVGNKDQSLGYIRLNIPEGETGVIVYDFEEPIPAADIVWVELFSPKMDVMMTWMNVTGKLGDTEYQFFDHECTGVVVGPGGCKRMRVY